MKRGVMFLAILGLGCVDMGAPGWLPQDEPLLPPPPPEPEAYTPSSGSLWRGDSSRRFLAFENRAKRVGDIVTVLISETATADADAKTELDRATSYDVNIESATALQTIISRPIRNILGFLGFSNQKTNNNPSGNIEILDTDATSAFSGEGKVERASTFATTVACMVTGVTPSGLLEIRGERHLTINHEKQIIELSGYVRPEDVRLDNSVPSALIASADIQYGGRGSMSEKTREPWLARFFGKVLPF